MRRNLLIVLVSCFVLAVFSKNSLALTFSDDFESYEAGNYLTGPYIKDKPNWLSDDMYGGNGWTVYEAMIDGMSSKVINFVPSPWPGGFPLTSNYATYHVHSAKNITSLYLETYYSCNTNSEIRTYISGDNQNWINVSDAIGMKSPLGENVWRKASGNVTSYISQADITKDAYVRFSSAAYSGSGWGAQVDYIKVDIGE